MTSMEVTTFNIKPMLEADDRRTVDDIIQVAAKVLRGASLPHRFVLGTQIQDEGIIQITSRWNPSAAQAPDSLLKKLSSIFGPVQDTFHVVLDQEAVENDDSATANVVEFVQTHFPVSRVSPEFQRQIEKDFLRFEEVYAEEAKGNLGLTYGWVLETRKIEGEDMKSFFVVRGWENMDFFEQSTQTDAFKSSIPILLGWNAPFKLWHVQRKALYE